MTINVTRTPIWTPLALLAWAVASVVVTDGLFTAPSELASALAIGVRATVTPAADHRCTIGDLRRLPYPDETPVVILNFGGDSSYRAVAEPKVIVAVPDDGLNLNWFHPEDSRANGRVAQQVLFVGSQ